jgi:hypothetical protein
MSIEQSVPETNHRLKSTTFDFTANSLIEGECDKKRSTARSGRHPFFNLGGVPPATNTDGLVFGLQGSG